MPFASTLKHDALAASKLPTAADALQEAKLALIEGERAAKALGALRPTALCTRPKTPTPEGIAASVAATWATLQARALATSGRGAQL